MNVQKQFLDIYRSCDQFGISKFFLLYFIINGESIKVRYMLYQVLYEIRYIKIFLNIMNSVLEKKFGKSRVRYIVGSLYRIIFQIGLIDLIFSRLKNLILHHEVLKNIIPN